MAKLVFWAVMLVVIILGGMGSLGGAVISSLTVIVQ